MWRQFFRRLEFLDEFLQGTELERLAIFDEQDHFGVILYTKENFPWVRDAIGIIASISDVAMEVHGESASDIVRGRTWLCVGFKFFAANPASPF